MGGAACVCVCVGWADGLLLRRVNTRVSLSAESSICRACPVSYDPHKNWSMCNNVKVIGRLCFNCFNL